MTIKEAMDMLERNGRVEGLSCDKAFVNSEDKTASEFWGGTLISFTYYKKNKKYDVVFGAYGDVEGCVYTNGEMEWVKDRGNNGILGEMLAKHTDSTLTVRDIYELQDFADEDGILKPGRGRQLTDATFFAGNSNWYELQIWNEEGELLTQGMDIQEYEDACITTESLDELINELERRY
jgi:hypothetical protein